MKKYINKNAIIIFALLILGGSYVYIQMSRKIPLDPPKTVVKYNGKSVPTSIGDCSWIAKSGGSSNETGGEYTLGQKTSQFTAKAGDAVKILIKSKPKDMKIIQLIGNYNGTEVKVLPGEKSYDFTLPNKDGDYIFEVFASWDDGYHNTATIFQVNIQK